LLQQTNKKQITTDAISDNTIEKIKQLVEQENAECVVTSPMDKLESFFIRTVTAAQQQAQPTSGAVSTTKIGDFLTQQISTSESILDKLVSAPVSQEYQPTSPATEKVDRAESAEPEPDEQLLSKLTTSTEPSQSESVVRDQTVKTQPVESQAVQPEQVKENILDQLTGRSTPQEDKEQTNKPQAGDTGDG
jgi:hypothetical protein